MFDACRVSNLNQIEILNANFYHLFSIILSYICNCKSLARLDVSYNSLTSDYIVSIIKKCLLLENISFKNTTKSILSNDFNSCLELKLESNKPLRYVSFKFCLVDELYRIIELFAKKWSSSLRIVFRSATVVELSC
jgi:hypothetical protein